MTSENEAPQRDPDAPLRGLQRRVLIEVPFTGETAVERNMNLCYLNACIADCLLRGEAPIAIPPMLVGAVTGETAELINEAIIDQWAEAADVVVCYTDRGTTPRMREWLNDPAESEGRTVEKWQEKIQAMPLYLAPGDAALIWEVKGHPTGQERIVASCYSLKDQPMPLLFSALSFCVSNADADPRLQREMIRFVDRINNIAGEYKKRAEASEKSNRS